MLKSVVEGVCVCHVCLGASRAMALLASGGVMLDWCVSLRASRRPAYDGAWTFSGMGSLMIELLRNVPFRKIKLCSRSLESRV